MSLRKEALACKAFSTLKDAYENREQFIKCSGKKAVWMLGADCPEEVIIAAGMLPVRVSGEYSAERVNADKFLELSFGPIWRGVFEKIANGKYDMEYLVLSNSSDMIQKIFYYLREIKRSYDEVKVPELFYLDYQLTHRNYKAQVRNLDELNGFVETIEKWSGNKVTAEAVKAASELCNELKQAMREFQALRLEGRVNGSEALVVYSGAQYVEKADAIKLVREITEEAKNWPVVDAVKVVYTGSTQETLAAYELMEESGINVIFEDNEFGARYFDKDVNVQLDPFRAIVDRYTFRFANSERGSVKERTDLIVNAVIDNAADALLVFMNFNDESYIWDYPTQRDKLKELGKKSITFEKQLYPLNDTDSLKASFAEFAATVRGGK